MDRVIELLVDKNEFLEKFYNLNESELLSFSEGNFDNLENFYNSRETILEMVSKIDGMIETTGFEAEASSISDDEKKIIIKTLSYKNELVTRILSQDLQILSCIEKAKSQIIKELAHLQAGKRALGSYKSSNQKAGLDEEA